MIKFLLPRSPPPHPQKGSGSTHNQTLESDANNGKESVRALGLVQEATLPRGTLVPVVEVVGWAQKALSASPQWRPPGAVQTEQMTPKSVHSLAMNTFWNSESDSLRRMGWFDVTGLSAFPVGRKKGPEPTSPIRIPVSI